MVDFIHRPALLYRLVVVLLLSACGGGGDSGSGRTNGPFPAAPATVLTVTTANSGAIIDETVDATLESAGGGELNPVAYQASSGQPAPLPVTRLLSRAIQHRKAASENAQLRVTAFSQRVACLESGSVVLDVAEDGSSETLTYENCSDSPGEIVNGHLQISNIVGNEFDFSASVSIDLQITQTGFSTFRTVGSFNFEYTDTGLDESIRISGSQRAFVNGSVVVVLGDFDTTTTISSTTVMINGQYSIASTVLNGKVDVDITGTLIADVGATTFKEGQITVRGANSGMRVTIDEASPHLTIDLDLNGDRDYSDDQITHDWSDLP